MKRKKRNFFHPLDSGLKAWLLPLGLVASPVQRARAIPLPLSISARVAISLSGPSSPSPFSPPRTANPFPSLSIGPEPAPGLVRSPAAHPFPPHLFSLLGPRHLIARRHGGRLGSQPRASPIPLVLTDMSAPLVLSPPTGPRSPVPLSPSSRRGRPGVSVRGNRAVNPGFHGIWVNPCNL